MMSITTGCYWAVSNTVCWTEAGRSWVDRTLIGLTSGPEAETPASARAGGKSARSTLTFS
jgi:hypothetical protein